MENTIQDNDALKNVRICDLVAKTAKTSLKDTQRVILAIKAIEASFGETVESRFAPTIIKPSETEAIACDDAYRQLLKSADSTPTVDNSLVVIETLRHIRIVGIS